MQHALRGYGQIRNEGASEERDAQRRLPVPVRHGRQIVRAEGTDVRGRLPGLYGGVRRLWRGVQEITQDEGHGGLREILRGVLKRL